jgi:hypothetical protein
MLSWGRRNQCKPHVDKSEPDVDPTVMRALQPEVAANYAKAQQQWLFDCHESHAEFVVKLRADFDGDGLEDRAVLETDSGETWFQELEGLVYWLLDARGNVREEHTLLLEAHYSSNIVTLDTLTPTELTATVDPNPRMPEEGVPQGSQAKLSLVWQKNHLVEASYLTECTLAKRTDTTIFLPTVSNVERKTSLDFHNYTQTQEEVAKLGAFVVRANSSGCDNLELQFMATGPFGASLAKDIAAFLGALEAKSHYSNVIRALMPHYAVSPLPESGATFDIGLEQWRGQLHYKYPEEKRRVFVLNLTNHTNPNQKTNWDIVTRKSRPLSAP